jgi:hypothetical protein
MPEALQRSSGGGFAGFHRRSSRRCRIASELTHAPTITNATIVLHHRLALEETISADQLAESLTKIL